MGVPDTHAGRPSRTRLAPWGAVALGCALAGILLLLASATLGSAVGFVGLIFAYGGLATIPRGRPRAVLVVALLLNAALAAWFVYLVMTE